MKKSTILGVLTAVALVSTSAATYAAWDQTSTTASKEFTVREQVTLSAQSGEYSTADLETTNDQIVYSGTVTFDIANKPSGATTLDLTPSITSGGTAIEASKYDIKIKEGSTELTATDGKYSDTTVSSSNPYTVELTIKDKTLAGQTIAVKIDGQLK